MVGSSTSDCIVVFVIGIICVVVDSSIFGISLDIVMLDCEVGRVLLKSPVPTVFESILAPEIFMVVA